MFEVTAGRPRLGVVVLDTAFPRPVGDIGNPASFDWETRYRVVPGVTVPSVVTGDEVAAELVERLVDAVVALARDGVDLIATSCGFLGALQAELQRASRVPVLSSALCLLPLLRSVYGSGRPLGVITFDARVLSRRHFGPWFDEELVIEGLEQGSELHRVIAGNLPQMDTRAARADAVVAARRLLGHAPSVGAVVLECTNLAPYRAEIRAAIGRPVYDINSAIDWFLRGAECRES